MTTPEDGDGSEAMRSATESALAARAALTQLHEDVVEAEERVVRTNAAQLLEANEQLVVSTMRAQAESEASAKELPRQR